MNYGDERGVRVVSVSGNDVMGRQPDLKPILDALDEDLSKYSWAVTKLDCFGPDTSEFCMSVQQARKHQEGVWIAGGDLAALAARIVQTVEAELVAFPKEDLDLRGLKEAAFEFGFHRSKAVTKIQIADNTFFTVLSKNEGHIERIRCQFPHTTDEDPTLFGLE